MRKKPTDRTHVHYTLRDGREIVYQGTTQANRLERRIGEHRTDGKQFTSVTTNGHRKTEAGAKRSERESLDRYRRNHGGRNPKYNKSDDG